MCGIFGVCHFTGRPVDPALVQRATTALRHRGPDDEGYLLADTQHGKFVPCGGPDTDRRLNLPAISNYQMNGFDLAFGFRRLAILDLSPAGHQPMATPDGRFWMVFNGEIYNYLELKQELESLDYEFRSHSDSEVLLTAYAHWGSQALNRLVGMFALAIFDTQKQKLFLARDFFGIKPLYYTFWSGGFAFASEIKALLELPQVKRQANAQSVYDYLRFRTTDQSAETLFTGINQLPAAHYLEIPWRDPIDKIQPARYWHIDLNQRCTLPLAEATGQLRRLFLENIQLHLRSDVPVGAALSGGIDSSSIVMAMRHLQDSQLSLHTFSYIAQNPKISEERWVDMVGAASDAQVFKVKSAPEDLIADLEHLIYLQDEPFGSTSIYAQYRVFKLAHHHQIKVMLDGQGADEMLGGYPLYLAARLASLLRHGRWKSAVDFFSQASTLPDLNKLTLSGETARLLLPANLQSFARQITGNSIFPPWLNADWFAQYGVKKTFQWNGGKEVLRTQLHQTLVELSLPMLLRFEDRNSMAFSIESRVPFLTPKLVSFILSLPEEYIIAHDGTTKAIFRQAMRGVVPDPILNRKDKIGFATPEQDWLTALRPWVDDLLHRHPADTPALNRKIVQLEWRAVLEGRKPFDFRIWRWINFIQWAKQYKVSFA